MFSNASERGIPYFLPDYRVYPPYDAEPLEAGSSYFQLFLVEMKLAKSFLEKRYPMVHTQVGYDRRGKNTIIPYLAKPEYLQSKVKGNLDRVIEYNHALTDLLPFNGGLVTVNARLFSMEASDIIKDFIKVMGKFADLLMVPDLSRVIDVVNPLYEGIETLTGTGKARLELGYRQTFEEVGGGGANVLRPGYFAVIFAEEETSNLEDLCVVDDHLKLGYPGKGKAFIKENRPLNDYSYMLFRLKKQSAQQWESLTQINDLVNKAVELVYQQDYEYVKRFLLPTIHKEIFTSADVAKNDRKIMLVNIKEELKEAGLESVGSRKRSLSTIMQRKMPEIDEETKLEIKALEAIFD